MKGIAVCGP